MACLTRKSTAEDVVRFYQADLRGWVAVVTGGTSGIGVEVVRALAGAGARVVFTGRNSAAGASIRDALEKEGREVRFYPLDQSDMDAVARFCEDVCREEKRIDLLVLNAGTAASALQHTAQGFERTFAVNHLAHFIMAARLRPLLESAVRTPPPHAPPGAARFGRVRVVVVASEAQAMSFPDEAFLEDPWFEKHPERYGGGMGVHWHYAKSKAANVMFARQLSRNWQPLGIGVYSLHPGRIVTEIQRDGLPGGIATYNRIRFLLWPLLRLLDVLLLRFTGFKSPQRGAAPPRLLLPGPRTVAADGQLRLRGPPHPPAAAAGAQEHVGTLLPAGQRVRGHQCLLRGRRQRRPAVARDGGVVQAMAGGGGGGRGGAGQATHGRGCQAGVGERWGMHVEVGSRRGHGMSQAFFFFFANEDSKR